MGIESHYLEDKNGNKFYPNAHVDATFDRNGNPLGNRLDDVQSSITEVDEKINKLDLVDNTPDIDKPVSTKQQQAIDEAYEQANKYADKLVADIIDGAPEIMDTFNEVAKAMNENKEVADALNQAIGVKANQTEVNSHTKNDTIHITASERNKWDEAYEQSKSIHSIEQGGTGAKTPKAAEYNITSGITESPTEVNDNTQMASVYSGASETQGRFYWRKAVTLWNYIKSKADAIYAKATHTHDAYTTKEEFNSLEIGGRNLYLGTKDFSGSSWQNISLYTNSDTYLGFSTKMKSSAWNGLCQVIDAKVGEVYTLSAYIKKESAGGVRFTGNCGTKGSGVASPSSVYIPVTTEWVRYSVTFTVTSSGTLCPGFESEDNATMYICGIKLEKGNKSTDWTPAPEDTVESANKLATARKIGKATFDGTNDIALSDIHGRAIATYSATTFKNKYTKVAEISLPTNWTVCNGIFSVSDIGKLYVKGLLAFDFKTDNDGSQINGKIYWISCNNSKYYDRIVCTRPSDRVIEIYAHTVNDYETLVFDLINVYNPNNITLCYMQEHIDTINVVYKSSLVNFANESARAWTVRDYNNIDQYIKIGHAGTGFTADNILQFAGYGRDGYGVPFIKDISIDESKKALGIDNLDRMYVTLTPNGAMDIGSDIDLNTVEFIRVRRYVCTTNAIVQTLKNCPTNSAFTMEVYNPLHSTYDDETTSAYVYRLRKITTYTGEEYTQFVFSDGIAGEFSYGQWRRTDTTYSAGSGLSLNGTTFNITCKSIGDWNHATATGFYQGAGATNAPTTGWCYGEVIAHTTSYLRQIVYRFAASTDLTNVGNDRYERVRHGGTWGDWVNTSVRVAVPSNAKFTDTTYGVATSSALGLVKSGKDITVDANGNVSVNDDSHGHIIGNIDGLQTALNGKASSDHAHSEYTNQNAFSNIKVGSTTISADAITDTLELVAGSNIAITTDTTNDKITISSTGGGSTPSLLFGVVSKDTSNPDRLVLNYNGQTTNIPIIAGDNVKITASESSQSLTISAPDTYSTSGVVIGTFADGSKLYRKVIYGKCSDYRQQSTGLITVSTVAAKYMTKLSIVGTTSSNGHLEFAENIGMVSQGKLGFNLSDGCDNFTVVYEYTLYF